MASTQPAATSTADATPNKPGLAALLGIAALLVSVVAIVLTARAGDTAEGFLPVYAAASIAASLAAIGLGAVRSPIARAVAVPIAVAVLGYQVLMIGFSF